MIDSADEGTLVKRTPNLTNLREQDAVYKTFIGMAHIAGTGPAGATCRECLFWRAERRFTDKETGKTRWRTTAHRYRSPDAEIEPNGLAKHRCYRPVLNKAKRKFPHHASACRLFEPNHRPPAQIRSKKSAEEISDEIED